MLRDVLVRPIQEMKVDVPTTLGRAKLVGREREIFITLDEYRQRHARVIAAQNAARDQCGVKILDPLPYLCHDGRCDALVAERSMYFDDDHLSGYGAAHLTPMFSTIFNPATAQRTAHYRLKPPPPPG